MRNKGNYGAVLEMKHSLEKIKNLTLEGFVMPGENDHFGEGDEGQFQGPENDAPVGQENAAQQEEGGEMQFDSNVMEAIVQIRKIAIGVIAKLADNPVSESYTFMKKVLDMSDKAMESVHNGGGK